MASAILPTVNKSDRSVTPTTAFISIPTALSSRTNQPFWVWWRWEWKETRWDKPPRRAGNQGYAKTSDPTTWGTADAAEVTARQHGGGLGIVLAQDTELVVLDLDRVIDDLGVVAPWAEQLIAECSSYTERSPSGCGFKVFGLAYGLDPINAKVPMPEGELEVFHHAVRYATVTGVSDAPDVPLADLTAVVTRIMEQKAEAASQVPGGARAAVPVTTQFHGGMGDDAPRREDVVRALERYWNPDDYKDWVDAALALHGVPWGLEVWLAWASKSPKFNDAENRQKWEQATPTGGITSRTILHRVPRDVLAEWGRENARASAFDISKLGIFSNLAIGSSPSDPVHAVRTYEELVEAAGALERNDTDGVATLLAEAAHAQLDQVKRERLFTAVKASTGLSIVAIRAQAKSGSKAEKLDQLALANITLKAIGEENVLSVGDAIWGWEQSGVWRPQDDRGVKRAIQDIASHHGQSVTAHLVNGTLDVLKSKIHQQGHAFNLGDPETVNCLNGELELEWNGWVLRSHRRENFRTTQIPVAYDRAAKAPRFRSFLDEVFRDDFDREPKKQALLEVMGYTLVSHARHEKFVILIGGGANGKSVLLGVLEALCGTENIAGVQPSNFDRSFQRAHLDHKLANIVTELKQGEVIADAELKAIVSGEPSTVEHKFKNPFVMRPFATCWIGTNHMPSTRDFSEALFRRALILTFNRTFTDDEKDPMLKEKLKAELPGILNMALSAYDLAVRSAFTFPKSAEEAKEKWRMEADQVAQFVDDCCARRGDGMEPVGAVYNAYLAWATEQGIARTMSQKGFRERLDRLGFGNKRTSEDRWVTGMVVNRQFNNFLAMTR